MIPAGAPTDGFLPRALLCAAFGVLVEATAYVSGLYAFQPQWLAIVVVVVAFGLILGLATHFTRNRGVAIQGLAGAAIGVLIELMNVHVAQFWIFGALITRLLPEPTIRAILLGSVGATVPILANALLAKARAS